jgi:hypothetical protein
MFPMPRVAAVSMAAMTAAMLLLGTAVVVAGQTGAGQTGAGQTGTGQKASGAQEMRSIVTLGELKDTARPLLIFAPNARDMRLMDQMEVVRVNRKEAKERRLVAVAVPETGKIAVGSMLGPDEAAKARRRFHVDAGEFAVVLVGKDGGEKLRSSKPLPFKRLEDVIDGMPMRQEEMKGKPR